MRPIRLLRTANFRLAAVYALTFGISAAILATLIYFRSTSELEDQARTRIQSEARALASEYDQGGLKQLLNAIAGRERGHVVGGLDYTVHDGKNRRYFGTLERLPKESGWSYVSGPPDGDEPPGQLEHLAVYTLPLASGLWLSIGDDFGRIAQFGNVILQTFAWAVLLTITLAIVGGVVLSAGFLGRVEAITETANAIIRGDIHRRIPRRGAHDELDELAATLNRMLDRISTLMEALRQVSNDIAHDLRMPLSRLRQALEDARDHSRTVADFDRNVARAVGDVDEILETFSAMLRIAQIEAGSRRSKFAPIDLSALMHELAETYGAVIEDTGRAFSADIAPGVRVSGDRELLVQLTANLLENAVRHTQDGATIKLSLFNDGPPRLAVSDNGPGIPAADRGRVFERFHRLDRSRATPGSGLGLSIVAAIADLHGMTVALGDNRPGLCVTITFADDEVPSSSRARTHTQRERTPA